MKISQKKNLIAVAVASAITAGAVSAQAAIVDLQGANKKATKQEETRYIVKFNNSSMKVMRTAGVKGKTLIEMQRLANAGLMARHGAKTLLQMDNANAAAAVLNRIQLSALRADPNVAYVEADPKRYLIDTVSRSFNPQAVETAAESAPYGIGLVQADQVSDANTGNMSVCITDTGYDGSHEDLVPYTSSLISGDDDNGTGGDTGDWWLPGHSHGTHVAGTIGALGSNDTGVVGVNPSGLLNVHNVKIFDNSGTWAYGSDLIVAIGQCSDAGANIISMSIGGGDVSATEEAAFVAFTDAGGINIAAAGNDGNTSLSYPASYDSVMSVGALNSNKTIASFSQRNVQVEIAAPGVSVNSTIVGGGYASWDGTSMATPHVSGVAALVWSHFPQCTGNQIRIAMIASAEDLGSAGHDNSYGHGLIQAKSMYDALTAEGCDVTPPPPPPPPAGGPLENGVAYSGISAGSGDKLYFTLDVPAGATDINFAMAGGTGDADMYVKFGSVPNTGDYDCRPYASGNTENCTGTGTDGTYHIMINGYSAFSDTSLTGSFIDGDDPTDPTDPTDPPTGDSYTNNTDVAIVDNSTVESVINVTGTGDSGSITVDVNIKHTYIGDMLVELISPSGSTVVLHDYTGASSDNIIQSYTVDAVGLEQNGQWILRVTDSVYLDSGFIDSWTINF